MSTAHVLLFFAPFLAFDAIASLRKHINERWKP